jgi:hypothetical protein
MGAQTRPAALHLRRERLDEDSFPAYDGKDKAVNCRLLLKTIAHRDLRKMRTRFKLALLAAAILAIAIFHTRLTRACGPFFPQIIFINTVHPDLPVGEFATGNLGIIQSTYGTIYLYVAYRNLAGRPLSPAEQTALWDNDQRLLTGKPMGPAQDLQNEQTAQADVHPDWRKGWYSATGQPTPQDPRSLLFESGVQLWAGVYRQIAMHQSGSTYYSQYLNCPQDAFRNAVSTLQRLTQQFGEASPAVKDWIQAQQTVFGNCNGGNTIPDPLPPSASAIARADRAYQIAAAHFYSGGYDKAAEDFRAIAKDPSSPWSTIAPYLVARSLVRKATMVEKEEPDLAALAQAEAQVNSVFSDPRLAKYHDAAQHLRGFIDFRLHPVERLVELASNLTEVSGDPNMVQDVIDFKFLFSRVENTLLYPAPAKNGDQGMTLAGVRSKSDLLNWMLTLQQGGADAYAHSLEKWMRTHSEAWLVAALMAASPDSPHLPELLRAAERIKPGSHAFDSVTFRSLRLMLLQGNDSEVRNRLDRLDLHHPRPSGFRMPASAVNHFLAMRFYLAQNLDELFASAARVPAMIADTSEPGDMPVALYGPYKQLSSTAPRLDYDALMVFNRFLPVAVMAKAVHSPELPKSLRREIALAAWTRAALLGESVVAQSIGPAVETFVPALGPNVRSYNSAKTPAEQNFVVILAALRFPGLRPFITSPERLTPIERIDDFRDNWWGTQGPLCAPPNPRYGNYEYHPPQWPQIGPALQTVYSGGKVMPPKFLTATEQAEASREWERLMAMSPAPDYLAAEAVAWGKANPSDPRVPEALALAVKSTRFGCVGPKTGEVSKAAFDLLHSLYPTSSWTSQTKYWFKM